MHKLRFTLRGGLDGVTPAVQPNEWALVGGWTHASLPTPVGILPAGLWGKVPAGDPYLAHISLLTTDPLDPADFFELQGTGPVQPRMQFQPGPGNSRLVLVRPTDQLRFLVTPQAEVTIELLIESIGGVNELGSRLLAWAEQAGPVSGVRSMHVTSPTTLPVWHGLLHVIHESGDADVITLPKRAHVPLDAVMTFARLGAGIPLLAAADGDSIVFNLPNQQIHRGVVVYNNGEAWLLAGM